MQGDAESEQLSIPDNSLLEVSRGYSEDKVTHNSGSTSRSTSFDSEASGDESDVSEVNDTVVKSWNSRDLSKINITVPEGRKGYLPKKRVVHSEKARQQSLVSSVLLSAASKKSHSTSKLSDARVAEKNNEGIMQNNYEQGENSSYNKCENSHRHGGKVGSISGGLGMLSRINFQELDKKKEEVNTASRASKLFGKVGKKMNAHPPSVQQLLKADQMICMEKALGKVVLNYNMLSYNGLYRSSSFYRSLDESFCEEEEELHELFKSNSNFIKYENAVSKLVSNNVKAAKIAKSMLLDLVNDAVEPAFYACVLMFFKETIRECDVLNTAEENDKIMEKNKDDINASVQLLKRASLMEPACSFLLGMMKRYDIGKCSQFMGGSWRDDLICVLNVVRDCGFFNIEQCFLTSIDYNNRWDNKKCGLGMRKKDEYIKEMGKYSLYELTRSTLSEQHFYANAVNNLFQILCKDDFPEALYSYAAILLQGKIGNMSKENIQEAMRYLNRAASAGHAGAEFLLGTLPFSKVSHKLTHDEIKRCILRLEDYINSSDDSCTMNKENVHKAAYCLAAEYYTKESYLVQHDKQKAEGILRSRGMYEELCNLQSRCNTL